jgi:hypothetical protein
MPPHNSNNTPVCPCCVGSQIQKILGHLNEDINVVNDNLYELDISRNNNKKDVINCAVCQQRIFEKSPMHKTECNHKFHAHCIILHLLKNRDCPVCREEILEDADNEHMTCLMGHLGKISLLVGN